MGTSPNAGKMRSVPLIFRKGKGTRGVTKLENIAVLIDIERLGHVALS
jgi:hypothetical protein